MRQTCSKVFFVSAFFLLALNAGAEEHRSNMKQEEIPPQAPRQAPVPPDANDHEDRGYYPPRPNTPTEAAKLYQQGEFAPLLGKLRSLSDAERLKFMEGIKAELRTPGEGTDPKSPRALALAEHAQRFLEMAGSIQFDTKYRFPTENGTRKSIFRFSVQEYRDLIKATEDAHKFKMEITPFVLINHS